MKPHILFITSTNLASNPRCRKEINLALHLNYHVSYIAFQLSNWTIEKEAQIQIELTQVEKIYISAGRENLLSWIVSTGVEYFLRKLTYHTSAARLISFAISKRSLQLIWALKRLKGKPDFIIAHNPAAFYPAYYYSKKVNIPFAIDIEDYHPGEGNNNVVSELNMQLIKSILPMAEYVSFAAPLIERKIVVEDLGYQVKKHFTINNVFSKEEFQVPNKTTNLLKIKMVWFSQYIDKGRGLEKMLEVMDTIEDAFEITLIGNIREEFYKGHLKNRNYVHLIPTLHQAELNSKLIDYDIGLAIEMVSADENRDICLTNKIWAYFQAGLYIVATNTTAQQNFLNQFDQHGVIVDFSDKEKLRSKFLKIYSQRHELLTNKVERFQKAKACSWEIESQKLQFQWGEIVGK